MIRAVPLGAAPVAIGYGLVVAGLIYAILSSTGGALIYPLDDTYIHMAMAKNTASHGVWGVTAEHFTSATSSPMWTALLTVTYAVFGVSSWTPLVLNILIGTAVVLSVYALVAQAGFTTMVTALAAGAIAFAGTLPTMTVLGMEHTLHILVAVWFVVMGARLAGGRGSHRVWQVAALAAVLTLTRYEGVFAVAAVVIALWLGGWWRAGAVIAAAGAVPLVLYGLWSQSHGGFLVPNSVLLKGVAPATTLVGLVQGALLWNGFTSLTANPHLAFLVIAVLGLAVLRRRDARARERDVLALVFVACTLLHLQFARVGWLFRYEAYLVVLGLVVMASLVSAVDWPSIAPARQRWPVAVTVALLTIVLAFPLMRRGINALRQTPQAAANIYQQPYQAGLFLGEFYRGRRAAINDIGAVGYLSEATMLDVWGLGSNEVADLKRRGAFTTAALAAMAEQEDVEIAIIHPGLLDELGGVPAAWQLAGEWRVTDNVVLGASAVSFYAVKAGAHALLVDNLVTFSSRLPAAVIQDGLYRANR